MPTTTTTYSFNKPVVGADEDSWGGYLNGNWDSVDDLLDGTTPITGIDINSGTIDNVVIGGATPAAGTFTTLTANTSITGTLATAAQPNITSVGTLTSLAVSGDVTFGDNDKAIFGAGSDLQIYHDGSNSIITDQGTGNLKINASSFEVNNFNDSSNILDGNAAGAVKLYHAGSQKLTTTSTGVDITGTLTSDGLTVDGDLRINTTSGKLTYVNDIAGWTVDMEDGTSDLYIRSGVASPTDRLKIEGNGDISFYEDTGTTAKFFWDASAESLGIGTTSPSAKLHSNVGAASTTGVLAENANDAASTGDLIKAYSARGNTSAYNLFKAENSTGVKFLVSGSGNVGIGTSSPTQKLQVSGGSFLQQQSGATNNTAPTAVTVSNLTTGAHAAGLGASLLFTYVNSGGGYNGPKISSISNADPFTSNLVFYSHNYSHSEAMRIDSSGNLLVGTTNTTPHNLTSGGGLSVRGSINLFSIARQDNEVMIVNRTGTDGDIALFRKDGTTVGSIGTAAGDLSIGNDDAFLFFDGGANKMVPASSSTGGASNGLLDLGASDRRFKDLYLSGGVYLGGTGAANHLDDYEEGTWTPTLPNGGTLVSNTSARYIKVGNVVTVSAYLSSIDPTANSSQFRIGGLPFATNTVADYYSGGSLGYTGQNNLSDVLLITGVGLTHIYTHENDGSASAITNNGMRSRGLTGDAADAMIFTLTYFT